MQTRSPARCCRSRAAGPPPEVRLEPDPDRCRRACARAANQEEKFMYARIVKLFSAVSLAFGLALTSAAFAQSKYDDEGVIKVKSAYPLDETIIRLKKDIAAKGIRFFQEIDQQKLAAEAGIKVRPWTLLVCGNPPLGTQFLAANPLAGLDWPVRLLVQQDENGDVW